MSTWSTTFWRRPFSLSPTRVLLVGLVSGLSLSFTLSTLTRWIFNQWTRRRQGTVPTQPPTKRIVEIRAEDIVEGVEGLIGNTPLIRINSLSDALGVEILGKCEYMNPFGSVKDRVSLQVIKQAEEEGLIHPHSGSCIFEGTSGSTGISIAGIARARGYKAHIVLPDDVAKEKVKMLEVLGATVERVRPVSIVDKNHYVNLARVRALEFGKSSSPSAQDSTLLSTRSGETPSRTPVSVTPRRGLLRTASGTGTASTESVRGGPDLLITTKATSSDRYSDPSSFSPPPSPSSPSEASPFPPRGLFADQFENLSNFLAHSRGTAQEIWTQTCGDVDAFVSGAGTGGTIAGVGVTLKKLVREQEQFSLGQSVSDDRVVRRDGRRKKFEVVLADPTGSGLYHKIKDGVMYAETESEGKRRRYQVDTIVEGIGLNRITKNLQQALPIIDDAYRVTDAEAVAMSRHLSLNDGLFLGSSSAVNLVTCVRLVHDWRERGIDVRGKKIVTILCDSGNRHVSRFWNDDYLAREGIPVSSDISSILYPDGAPRTLPHSSPAPRDPDAPSSPPPAPVSASSSTTTSGTSTPLIR
ncbi:hypothetical protein JCM10212_003787 [Sporobolomyces blumeae]